MTHLTPHWVQVLAFGGELLSNAEGLLRSGLHTTEVADGYLKAGSKVCAQLLTSPNATLFNRSCLSGPQSSLGIEFQYIASE